MVAMATKKKDESKKPTIRRIWPGLTYWAKEDLILFACRIKTDYPNSDQLKLETSNDRPCLTHTLTSDEHSALAWDICDDEFLVKTPCGSILTMIIHQGQLFRVFGATEITVDKVDPRFSEHIRKHSPFESEAPQCPTQQNT